jgi:hypothetical protein
LRPEGKRPIMPVIFVALSFTWARFYSFSGSGAVAGTATQS